MNTPSVTCEQVVVALRSIARALDLHYKYLLRTFGLSGPQIIVLKTMESQAPRPITEVAREARLSHATVTEILDRLERRKLVMRTPGDMDRRQVFVSLTDAGQEIVKRSPALLHDRFISDFTALEPWEQNQILSSLQRVATMIGTPHEVNPPLLSIAPLHSHRGRQDGTPPNKKSGPEKDKQQ